ncbi:hypothetical protein G4B88_010578 [Cannabis sativa]|uniref:DUF4283 domain-containing protein n=1 Tax=Cannabis sativa TaxID=3483 RepID=A0A7J6G8B6_CANSA|nr:hypothetical protein G4B88_010578 [Cannabis sativa]
MASSSSNVDNIEEGWKNIQLEEEEAEETFYEENEERDEEDDLAIDSKWCLVGRMLTGKVSDFRIFQNLMADLWKPGKGMYAKQLDQNRFLFQFYHELDIKRVIEGSPWTYDRKQLIITRLNDGDNPRTVNLNTLDLWLQIHDLQNGFMTMKVNFAPSPFLRSGKVATATFSPGVNTNQPRDNHGMPTDSIFMRISSPDISQSKTKNKGTMLYDSQNADVELTQAELKRKRFAAENKNGLAVEVQGHKGGLALLWRFNDGVRLLGFSHNHIDIEIAMPNSPVWRLTGTSNWVEIRLDKALVSSLWLDSFPSAILTNGDFSSSDHTPLFLDISPAAPTVLVHHFRFENAWTREPLCAQIVQACWDNNAQLPLLEKISICSKQLEDWGRSLTCNFKRRLKQSKAILTSLKGET